MKKEIDWILVARYLKNECSEKEKDRFEQWLEQSESNQQIFEDIKEGWEKSNCIHQSFKPNKKAAWKKIDARTGKKGKTILLNSKWLWRVAAMLVLGLNLWLLYENVWHDVDNHSAAMLKIENKANKPAEHKLADGTKVWLRHGSVLTYPREFSEAKRNVKLVGEAFFEVSHNPDKPFEIVWGKGIVKVLGTSFNLGYGLKQQSLVSVVSGKVSFAHTDSENEIIFLTKGKQGSLNGTELSQTNYTSENFLAWKTGKLKFSTQSLIEVCKELSLCYEAKVEPLDEKVGQIELNASFDKQTLPEVVEIIAITLDLETKTEKGIIKFSKKE